MSDNVLGAWPLQAASGAGASVSAAHLGPMPTWKLDDLYPSPKSAAVAGDLKIAAESARNIKQRYQGKFAELAQDGAKLAEAIAAYESLSDTIGRLGSYAGLLFAADMANSENAKFYGDIQEKITAITTELIFFELELNKLDEGQLARAAGAGAGALQALDQRPTQGEALSTRRAPGAALPREVDHGAQRLEPAFQRDHDGTAVRGGRRARTYPA